VYSFSWAWRSANRDAFAFAAFAARALDNLCASAAAGITSSAPMSAATEAVLIISPATIERRAGEAGPPPHGRVAAHLDDRSSLARSQRRMRTGFPGRSGMFLKAPLHTSRESGTVTSVSEFGRYREHVLNGLAAGLTLDQLEEQLLGKAPLDEDQKAALWLYGFSMLDLHKELGPVARQLEPVGSG
jgi:hypothetical protein